jgi:hypothetical protein
MIAWQLLSPKLNYACCWLYFGPQFLIVPSCHSVTSPLSFTVLSGLRAAFATLFPSAVVLLPAAPFGLQ